MDKRFDGNVGENGKFPEGVPESERDESLWVHFIHRYDRGIDLGLL